MIDYEITSKEALSNRLIVSYKKTTWHWKRDIYGRMVREFDEVINGSLNIPFDSKYYEQFEIINKMLSVDNRYVDSYNFVKSIRKQMDI